MAARIKAAAPPTDSAIVIVMSDIELLPCNLTLLAMKACKRGQCLVGATT
jgi:hypothetical protein